MDPTSLHLDLWLLWLLAVVGCLIVELFSGTIFLFCIAVGCLFGMVTSLLSTPLWVQILTFCIATTLSLFFVRPFVVKFLHRNENARQSNADALIGRVGVVEEPISAINPGYIKIDGDVWKAVSLTGKSFDVGEKVRVVQRDSIVLTVEPDIQTF